MATNKINSSQMPRSEDWHIVGTTGEPAFLNSWENYHQTYPVASFFKDSGGTVHLKGLIRNGTANTDIFILPVGYRPAQSTHHHCAGHQGDPMSIIHVESDGTVKARTGNNSWMSLDGLSFRADA